MNSQFAHQARIRFNQLRQVSIHRVTLSAKILALASTVACATASNAYATMYFSFNAEGDAVGSSLTNEPFCGFQCGAGTESGQTVGRIGSTGGAPQGSKYFYWNIVQNQHDHYNEIRQTPNLPSGANLMGKTLYLAYHFRFDRQSGGARYDVFESGSGVQSAEKGIEIRGPGLRWITSIGQWDSLASNQAGKFTVWPGNPSYHLNRSLEHNDVFYPNQSGYSNTNTQQLDYEKWHSVVFAIKLANNSTGSVALWVDDTKTFEYTNIQTVDSGTTSARVDYLELGGTLCQPAYDCPPHVRKYDAMILTDNWQDIVSGGYVGTAPASAPPAPTLNPPSVTP